ncbi:MAG: T9SS type A sorting domain-containing protein [Calditrichia bacterium]
MRYAILSVVGMLLSISLLFASPPQNRVLRVGGLELSPYSYGYMETHPHRALDTTNTEFANYYAMMSLWIGGVTENGDTIITCPELKSNPQITGFFPRRMYRDTTNVLHLPNVRFTTISLYEDTTNGWQVGQFNIALRDHSAGVLLYLIRYHGYRGNLNNVYAGVKFDFDVPNLNNAPSSDDDVLLKIVDGYSIRDFQSQQGMDVQSFIEPVSYNYWERDASPRTSAQLFEKISQNNPLSPPDTADYHFYTGHGPYAVQQGDVIILGYFITPYSSGFSKTAGLQTDLKTGLKMFARDKKLASFDLNAAKSNKETGNVITRYQLFQNFPNPFNPVTDIKFAIPEAAKVKIEIFNALGQRVTTLIDKQLQPGEYTITWNSTDANGNAVSSGVYIYRMTTDDFQSRKKMILIR